MTEQAIIARPETGETFSAFGSSLTFKVTTDKTADRIGIYAIEMDAFAKGPKLHFHREMDETFIISEGVLTVLTADGATEARAGTIVYIPRGTVHGYNNNSADKVKMTMIFSPGHNREDFFRRLYKGLEEQPEDLSFFQQLYEEHDSYPVNNDDMIPLK
jgi:quercetin dioxygenase-like cupin family protein